MVMEVRLFDQYVVRVDGSVHVMLQNRKFFWKFLPVITHHSPNKMTSSIVPPKPCTVPHAPYLMKPHDPVPARPGGDQLAWRPATTVRPPTSNTHAPATTSPDGADQVAPRPATTVQSPYKYTRLCPYHRYLIFVTQNLWSPPTPPQPSIANHVHSSVCSLTTLQVNLK